MKRPGRDVWTPRRREWRRVLAAVLGGAVLAAGLFLLKGRLDPEFLRDWLPRTRVGRETRPVRASAPEAVLAHRVAALRGLLEASAGGHLIAPGPRRAVVAVDQRLVVSLLRAHLPAHHVVADRFRVQLAGAHVDFEDGLALVRLDGRVSLADRPDDDVYADLTVFGDLALLPHQPSPEALRAQVRVIGVEARDVQVGVRAREVDRLVEEVSRAQLQDLARLGPELDIPVRLAHTFQIPGLGPDGPVRIARATLDASLTLVDVRAFAGQLWLAADVAVGDGLAGNAAAPPRIRPLEAEPAGGRVDVPALRAEHAQLHQVLEARLADDPVLAALDGLPADVTFVVPQDLVSDVGREVARRLLDRVELDLRGIDVEHQGEMRKDTAIGRIRAGRWRLQVAVDRVRGVLRAGRPDVRITAGERVAVDLPVAIEGGRGEAAMAFDWDSTGIANLVCRDFEVRERVAATIPADTHVVRGTVRLEVDGDVLRITPSADRRFQVRIDPTPEAWAAARNALEREDKWWRCGIGMNPEVVLRDLRRIVARGIKVRLPAKLFRPISVGLLPETQLDVAGTVVAVRGTETRLVLHPERVILATRLAAEIEVQGVRRALEPGPVAPRRH